MSSWVTVEQAQDYFNVNRSTIYRWRRTYEIREVKARGFPLMLHMPDLIKADSAASTRNPVLPKHDATFVC